MRDTDAERQGFVELSYLRRRVQQESYRLDFLKRVVLIVFALLSVSTDLTQSAARSTPTDRHKELGLAPATLPITWQRYTTYRRA
jgi:hypothetical protein